ncbi:amidase signature domain-containing protein [Aspergillus oleicola]
MAQVMECAGSHDKIITIDDGETRYIVHESDTDVQFPHHDDFSLVTVFDVPESVKTIHRDWIRDQVDSYMKHDDVFHESFLAGVIFSSAEVEELVVSDESRAYLAERGNQFIVYDNANQNKDTLPPGPYVIIGERLRNVWRLFEDPQGAFMTTLQPQVGGGSVFSILQLKDCKNRDLSIALPSKIKTTLDSTSPLAGWRIAIKDNIHLKGIRTSVGNYAFSQTFPPQPKTAACIQRLVDQGAVIVGKTKMNSFGNWEEPLEYIDYQAPWSPRADGYQSTGGSSSGSAVAVAAYEWVDVAVGTDTWGSVTRPALWCGCFALRPSIGAVSPEGVEPYVKAWDIPGLLGRDLQKCRAFATAWLLEDALTPSEKPSAIIWPTDYWDIIDAEQRSMALNFVQDMESYLDLEHTKVSFDEAWEKSPPPEAEGRSLNEFICPATIALAYDVYHNGAEFREKYREKFNKEPYTSPPNQRLWKIGATVTRETRDAGFKDIDTYAGWFKDTILKDDLSNALVVMPLESICERYRDEVPLFKRPPQDGINTLALAPVLKAPALTVPIGEISFNSRISGNEEKLPFAVAVMSPPGIELT